MKKFKKNPIFYWGIFFGAYFLIYLIISAFPLPSIRLEKELDQFSTVANAQLENKVDQSSFGVNDQEGDEYLTQTGERVTYKKIELFYGACLEAVIIYGTENYQFSRFIYRAPGSIQKRPWVYDKLKFQQKEEARVILNQLRQELKLQK